MIRRENAVFGVILSCGHKRHVTNYRGLSLKMEVEFCDVYDFGEGLGEGVDGEVRDGSTSPNPDYRSYNTYNTNYTYSYPCDQM